MGRRNGLGLYMASRGGCAMSTHAAKTAKKMPGKIRGPSGRDNGVAHKSASIQHNDREAAVLDNKGAYSSPLMNARRKRILAEARNLIAEKGYQSFNIRELASRAGVAQR